MSNKTEYNNPSSCNKCRGENDIYSEVYEQGLMYECMTKCLECGFEDYWSHGFYESGAEMESKCKKYSFSYGNKNN